MTDLEANQSDLFWLAIDWLDDGRVRSAIVRALAAQPAAVCVTGERCADRRRPTPAPAAVSHIERSRTVNARAASALEWQRTTGWAASERRQTDCARLSSNCVCACVGARSVFSLQVTSLCVLLGRPLAPPFSAFSTSARQQLEPRCMCVCVSVCAARFGAARLDALAFSRSILTH